MGSSRAFSRKLYTLLLILIFLAAAVVLETDSVSTEYGYKIRDEVIRNTKCKVGQRASPKPNYKCLCVRDGIQLCSIYDVTPAPSKTTRRPGFYLQKEPNQ